MEPNTSTIPKKIPTHLKSGLSLFLSPLFVLLLFSATSHALTTGTSSEGFVYQAAGNQVSITGYTGTASVLTITDTINVSGSNLPVVTIGSYAFEGKDSLTSVTIPASVTSIGSHAFSYCSNLAAITTPPQNSMYSTLNGVLFNHDRTTLIQYPQSLTGSYIIPSTVTTIQEAAFSACTLTGVTIPGSVVTIGDSAFYADRLTSVIIPSSVTSIGTYAFYGYSLLSITMPEPNSMYSTLDGVLFNSNQTTLIQYPGGRAGSYTIPDSVTTVTSYSFLSSINLTGVMIPSSVTNIGDQAFKSCYNLTDATFFGNAPLMGKNVFSGAANNFKVNYYNEATGFASPNWTDSSNESYPSTNLGAQPGTLKVTIDPAGAVSTGAQWQVDGGTLQSSEAAVTGLLTGTHTLSFSSVVGWTTPVSQTVTVLAGQTTSKNGTYAAKAGFFQVIISPSDAVNAGAQWQLDGKAWHHSGEMVSGYSTGRHTVSFSAVEGWQTPADISVSISPTFMPSTNGFYLGGGFVTVVAAQNDPAPGVIGGKFLKPGCPAVDSFGDLVFKATVTGIAKSSAISSSSNTGIWYYTGTTGSLMARTGAAAPDTLGAVLTGLSDPALHEDGAIIFGGSLAEGDVLKTKNNAAGIWLSDGLTTNLIVRSGGSAADQPGTQYNQFEQIVTQQAVDAAFLATLTGTNIKSNTNTGLWGADLAGTLHSVIRTGDSLLAGTGQRTVAAINAFPITKKESGQSRSVDTVDGHLTFVLTFADKSSAICVATPQASGFAREFVAATWDADVPGVGQTQWSAFGNPAVNANGTIAFEAALMNTVTKTKSSGLWLDSGTTTTLLARSAGAAPDCGGALFSSFDDPVLNHNDRIAFIGSLLTEKNLVTPKTASGIWANTSGTMRLLARTGDSAPGVVNGLFSEFDQVVLPDTGGPILLAKIGGVKATVNTGIWSVDSAGQLQLLFQTGSKMRVHGVSKVIASFSIFTACPQVAGQSRGFDASTRALGFLVTFSDKTWAIINAVAP